MFSLFGRCPLSHLRLSTSSKPPSTTLAFSFGSLCWATFQGRWRFNVLRSGNVRLLSLRITFPFYRTFRPAYLSAKVVLASVLISPVPEENVMMSTISADFSAYARNARVACMKMERNLVYNTSNKSSCAKINWGQLSDCRSVPAKTRACRSTGR